MKKFISTLMSLIIAVPCLTSCFSGEPQTPTTQDSTDETSTATEEIALHSFFAKQTGYTLDEFVCYVPEEGTAEAELWEYIYVDRTANSDLLIYHMEGESYEVIYSGEIVAIEDSKHGYIENPYSIRIKTDSREYDGINYKIAIMREAFAMKQFKEDTGSNVVLAKSIKELSEMIDRYFFVQKEIPDDATDFQKKSITSFNNRKQLIDGYDEEFFKQYDLFMIPITSGSGGHRFDVTDILIESGVCTVTYENTVKGSSDDMADWIIIVAIPKEVSASVTEYNTYMPMPEWYQ